MSDATASDAADAARFRYLMSQVSVTTELSSRVNMVVVSDDLDGIFFDQAPTFRELVDAMMANAAWATGRSN